MTRKTSTSMEPGSSIQELVASARDGDREAFDRLIERFHPRLERHVKRRLTGSLRRHVEPEDVMLQSYARAWKGIRRFEWAGEGAFLRWLQRIAERVILSAAAAQRPDEVIYLETPPDTGTRAPSPSAVVRREERFDRLQAALDELEPDYRQAVLLVRVEGLKLREAAQRMGRSPNAVMHLLRRALKKLKERIGDTASLALPPRRLDAGRATTEDERPREGTTDDGRTRDH